MVVYQPASVTPTAVVAGIHPFQRTVDVVNEDGSPGAIEFRVDMINTTLAQSFDVDLAATMELPDGSLVQLPMGPGGQLSQPYHLPPNDFSFTSVVDPVGMTFAFPLDQLPGNQPVQEGTYHMEVQVFEGGALLYENEDVDFWVVDRSGKPFRDVTRSAGLDVVHLQGGNLPSAGNSLAVLDYQGDGLTDLFFTNPSGAETYLPVGANWPFPGGRNYLMRNDGGSFSDVTAAAGVAGLPSVASYGVTWGDLDRDGFLDVVVANREHQIYVYRNDGDGTFTDVADGSFGGATAIWHEVPRVGDYDADGDLDLYLADYMAVFDTTWQLVGWPNNLYRNESVEGIPDPLMPSFPAFTRLLPSSGVQSLGLTLASFFHDADRDGNLDLAVFNDFGGFGVGNELFLGDGAGNFTDVSAATGFEVHEWSMGAAAFDCDGDQDLDVYSTNLGRNSLLQNNGDGSYSQAIEGSGSEGDFLLEGPQADGINLSNNWGVVVWDYDKDRDLDLYVVGSDLETGEHVPIAEIHPDSTYENDGTGSFTLVSEALGLANAGRGRGCGALDYDLDGDLDIVVSNENEGAGLYRNDFTTANHHLAVRPVATRSAPGAFNTYFTVSAGGLTQVHELMAASAHGGQKDNSFWFGLGAETSATVVAEWPRGGSTTVFLADADQELLVHETVIEVNGAIQGSGQQGTAPLVRLLGPPGALAIGTLGQAVAPFPLPGGGFLDVIPLFTVAHTTFLGPTGEAVWDLGTLPASAVGKTGLLQMVILDLATFTVPVKSGVSTLTVTP